MTISTASVAALLHSGSNWRGRAIYSRGGDKVRKRTKILVHFAVKRLVIDFEDARSFRLIPIGRRENLRNEIAFELFGSSLNDAGQGEAIF